MVEKDIDRYEESSGRMLKENDEYVNLADILEHVEEHSNAIDHGEAFMAKGSVSIASGDGSKWILGQTGDEVISMLFRELEIISANLSADITLKLWEGIQAFTGGTPVTVFNSERNPEYQIASTFNIVLTPTTVTKGSAVEIVPLGTRKKVDKEQSYFESAGNRYNMKKNTIYGIEITNAILNASTVNIIWKWYINRIKR